MSSRGQKDSPLLLSLILAAAAALLACPATLRLELLEPSLSDLKGQRLGNLSKAERRWPYLF